jgi:hypothetical protein
MHEQLKPGRKPWIIGAIAAALVLAVVAYLVIRSDGGPRAVAEAYLVALRDGDTGTAHDLTCEQGIPFNPPVHAYHDLTWTIVDTSVDGDRATVVVHFTPGDVPMTLLRSDGHWRVCQTP